VRTPPLSFFPFFSSDLLPPPPFTLDRLLGERVREKEQALLLSLSPPFLLPFPATFSPSSAGEVGGHIGRHASIFPLPLPYGFSLIASLSTRPGRDTKE